MGKQIAVKAPGPLGIVASVALSVVAVGPVSCGGRTPTSPLAATEQPTVKVTTAHFQIVADRAGSGLLADIAGALESDYPRITSDLRVANLPVTSVYVWQDSTSFYGHMQSTAGTVFQGATGWVPGPHTVSILAAPGSDAIRAARAAVHEFAHVVSIAVNSSIGNNPRWLWETVALYENREFIDPATLDYMRAGDYPSLANLDVAYDVSGRVYQVGYVLGEYIVQRWGLDGLVRLIQRNGDLAAALGVTTAEFESGWHAFLHEKYGLPVTLLPSASGSR